MALVLGVERNKPKWAGLCAPVVHDDIMQRAARIVNHKMGVWAVFVVRVV